VHYDRGDVSRDGRYVGVLDHIARAPSKQVSGQAGPAHAQHHGPLHRRSSIQIQVGSAARIPAKPRAAALDMTIGSSVHKDIHKICG
jgi:hypothetical protein